jgi:HSP20 family protein
MHNKRRSSAQERQPGERQWVVQGYMVWRPNTHFNPPTDVIELNDRLVVRVEVAGMRPDSFTVALMNHHLVISGTRERPLIEGAAYHQVEIGYGDFRVQVLLPWLVEADQVNATYRDGFLEVELPRRLDTLVRVVDVTEGEESVS